MEVLYTKTHEWVQIEGDHATVGMTDHAQSELGDIVFIELPQVGEAVTRGLRFGTIESTKAASELFAPLSGEVIEVNNELIDNPQWINEEPLTKGWMVKIKIKDTSEAGFLLDEAAYKMLVEEESS